MLKRRFNFVGRSLRKQLKREALCLVLISRVCLIIIIIVCIYKALFPINYAQKR
jgi:preprotein translocase subunit SecF